MEIIKLHEGELRNEQPQSIEPLQDGKGGFNYNYDIISINVEEGETGEINVVSKKTSKSVEKYKCNRLVMDAPKTANHILSELLKAKYPSDVEAKLVNDYNSAMEGIGSASKDAYIEFLSQRAKIKEMVDNDCKKSGIPNE